MRDAETVSKYHRFFRGDEAAVDLAMMIIHVADVWDDLIDKDCTVSDDALNQAFSAALCGLPRNTFYRSHLDELLPLLEISVLNWLTANAFERTGDRKAKEIAHVIRHGLSDLFIHMARLIGGMAWGAVVAPEIKLLVHNDTLDEYLKE